jgi:hypothetical protein
MRFEAVTSEYKSETLLLEQACLVAIMGKRNSNELKKTI